MNDVVVTSVAPPTLPDAMAQVMSSLLSPPSVLLIGLDCDNELSRFLDLAADTPYEHPNLGEFRSLLGQWYWQITGAKREQFRELAGEDVLAEARLHSLQYTAIMGRERYFAEGVTAKLATRPELRLILEQLRATHPRLAIHVQPRTLDIWSFKLSDGMNWTNPTELYTRLLLQK